MSTADGFINIDRSYRNVGRWIIRTAIRDEFRQVYPLLEGRLLDAGCGRMPYRQEVLSRSAVTSYVGLDIENAIPYDENVQPDQRWDGVTMPFEDALFDCAIATEVLEHLPDIQRFLKEIKRVVRPGGRFFFTTPFLWSYHEVPYDFQRMTVFGLREHLSRAGFQQIKVKAIGNWHSTLALMLGLWVERAPLVWGLRRLLRYLVLGLQQVLMKFDAPSDEMERSMCYMCSGTAIVPKTDEE